MFDDVMMKGRCPACGCETHQTKRWFKTVRDLATTASLTEALEGLLKIGKPARHEAARSDSMTSE